MAKSMRSKREKRLRAIRRDMVEKESFYQKKDEAKLAALEAARAAPKLPVRATSPLPTSPFMDTTTIAVAAATNNNDMDVDTNDNQNEFLKPVGGVGKKSKRKFKMGKKKRRGKGILGGKKRV